MKNNLTNLISPIKINSLELKNRAVMPAMGTAYANNDGTINDRLITYLARRAAGGAGLITTEVFAVDKRGKGFPAEAGIWDDSFIPDLTRLTEAVHKEGAAIAVQLHHAGRETAEGIAGAMPEGPSPLPSVMLRQPVEEMSTDRIKEVVTSFGESARRAEESGFDAVEVHGAHGYLLCQFLSPFSNQRTDQYGGSDENRARFVIEVIEKVRQSVSPGFPVIVRISADEMIREGYTIDFSKWLAPRLVKAGADALHVSLGVYSTPGGLSIAAMDVEPGFNLFRAKEIKEIVDVPVIGVGRIHDPRIAEKALAAGEADLISFGRQHLTDPGFINKALENRYEDIRFCIACNQGCIERLMFEFKPTTCVFNPECGEEYNYDLSPSPEPKDVWIAGAGPAGLSAAQYAALKGHRVRIFEASERAGGQLISASAPPNKEVLESWLQWILRQLEKAGIKPEYNTPLTAEMAAEGKPDVVIYAAGSIPTLPPIPGLDKADTLDARDILLGKTKVNPGKTVILGAGYVGMETADYLVDKGSDVTILEQSKFPPVSNMTSHGYFLHRRLKKGGAVLELGAEIKSVENGRITYSKDNNETVELQADSIVTALGATADSELADALETNGVAAIRIGDAKKPGRFLEAIHGGARAALKI